MKDDLNLYVYTGDDPLDNTDVTGTAGETILGIAPVLAQAQIAAAKESQGVQTFNTTATSYQYRQAELKVGAAVVGIFAAVTKSPTLTGISTALGLAAAADTKMITGKSDWPELLSPEWHWFLEFVAGQLK